MFLLQAIRYSGVLLYFLSGLELKKKIAKIKKCLRDASSSLTRVGLKALSKILIKVRTNEPSLF